MSQPSKQGAPTLNLRGAVDLSQVGNAPSTGAGESASGGSSWVRDVAEADLNDIVQLSMTVPVVLDLWAESCQPCKTLTPILEKLVRAADGRLLLGKIDVEANPRVAQAFGAQSVPTVVAIVKGQPVPLFQGAVPEQQVSQVFAQLLQMAEQNGVNGKLPPESGEAEQAQAEPELPPLHQAAVDALMANDLTGAATAYEKAIAENPGDDIAKSGLARVGLLQRVADMNAETVRAKAATEPKSVDACLAVADLDAAGGHVEDAFTRIIDLIRVTFGEDRDTLREHLVGLFTAIGDDDPRVTTARRALASALF